MTKVVPIRIEMNDTKLIMGLKLRKWRDGGVSGSFSKMGYNRKYGGWEEENFVNLNKGQKMSG